MASAEEQFHRDVRARLGKEGGAAPAAVQTAQPPGSDADARYQAKLASRLAPPAPAPKAKAHDSKGFEVEDEPHSKHAEPKHKR